MLRSCRKTKKFVGFARFATPKQAGIQPTTPNKFTFEKNKHFKTMKNSNPSKYSLTSRILHWSMAALILFLLGLGIYMTDFLPKDAPNRMEVYDLHKSFGALVLVLIFIRIINRFIFKAPALPATLVKWEKIAAHLGHAGLYLLMIAVPLSGYLMSNSFGYPVHFFGIELPFLIEKNLELGGFFAEAHEISAFSLLGLVAIHVLGALKHRFFDKPENDVLKRML